ncbi:MAG: hypothetical protein ACYDC2_01100, partial [Solirubrobacteraceae bacterium]
RDALAIAGAGVASMRERIVAAGGGAEQPLDSYEAPAAAPRLVTGEVRGSGTRVRRLELPYGGRLLHGEELLAQLERWVEAGTIEPSCARAAALVVEHPEWLELPGRTIALIGAGSEIGPLEALCAWGADVLAVDLPSPEIWERIHRLAARGAGTLRMPVASDGRPGLDVVAELAETGAWLRANLAGEEAPVLGMHAYADGGAHVLLSAAFDVLASELLERGAGGAGRPNGANGPGATLAYLATPTDSYLVPPGAVERARAAYRARGGMRRLAQAPLQALSGRRLFRPAYGGGAPVADALIEQQGPNYALAKRLQRWRGLLAEAAGERVSFNVAPATWTRSVTKNRVLAAAYRGARRFGIEIFEPATTRVLMAALLVHDLNSPPSAGRPPEQLFSDGAAHGGLWTAAYEPRSALGVAAVAGLPGTMLDRTRGGSENSKRKDPR